MARRARLPGLQQSPEHWADKCPYLSFFHNKTDDKGMITTDISKSHGEDNDEMTEQIRS